MRDVTLFLTLERNEHHMHKYTRMHIHADTTCTHIALWLKVMGEGPGGHENAFCDPLYTISTSHWSVKNGTAPKDATVSTTRMQLYL